MSTRRVERVRPLVLILLCFAVVYGCSREPAIKAVDLPSTPELTLRTSWGVITADFLRLRAAASEDSEPLTTLWRGSILEIISRSAVKGDGPQGQDYWYQVRHGGVQGWVYGGYLSLYVSREKAEATAKEILEQ